jgi:nucleoid DNA-binding protein
MNKPPSMSIKEYLVKKIAINNVCDKMVSEKIIDTVISHQFDSASKATSIHNSVEISGFGKFAFNQKRAMKQMQKYESQIRYFNGLLETDLSDADRRNVEMKMQSTLNNIKSLKPKLNEPSTDNRGMEE